MEKCRSYIKAEAEAQEFLIIIENHWTKIGIQIEFLKSVAYTLRKEYRDMQSQLLSQLEGKLKTASLTMDQLLSDRRRKDKLDKHGNHGQDIVARLRDFSVMSPRSKWKYSWRKESIQNIVNDLDGCQSRFDPSWMLIITMSQKLIAEKLKDEALKPILEQNPYIIAAKKIRDAIMGDDSQALF